MTDKELKRLLQGIQCGRMSADYVFGRIKEGNKRSELFWFAFTVSTVSVFGIMLSVLLSNQ